MTVSRTVSASAREARKSRTAAPDSLRSRPQKSSSYAKPSEAEYVVNSNRSGKLKLSPGIGLSAASSPPNCDPSPVLAGVLDRLPFASSVSAGKSGARAIRYRCRNSSSRATASCRSRLATSAVSIRRSSVASSNARHQSRGSGAASAGGASASYAAGISATVVGSRGPGANEHAPAAVSRRSPPARRRPRAAVLDATLAALTRVSPAGRRRSAADPPAGDRRCAPSAPAGSDRSPPRRGSGRGARSGARRTGTGRPTRS